MIRNSRRNPIGPEVVMERAARFHRAPLPLWRRCLGLAAAVFLSGMLSASTLAEDMPKAVFDHVRRATVMVLMEIPGTNEGGSGTGEFINSNGLLITNNHVVDPNHGKSIEARQKSFRKVTLPKYQVVVDSGTRRERTYDAELLHQSEPTDLALLQLKPDPKGGQPHTPHFLRFAPTGTLHESLKIWVFGFPGGLRRGSETAITFGLITECTRSQSGLIHYLESDATVHPGNSGGPFVDVNGYLVGVATHKRFSEGAKDRSGAVPVHLVEGFLRSAFYEDRVPQTADVLPLVDIFTDQDGIVEFPNIQRAEDACTVHFAAGDQVRRGKPLTDTMAVTTSLGRFTVELAKAAYVFVDERQATLVMDGGDYLRFAVGSLKIPMDMGGEKRNVALSRVKIMAFARPADAVQYPRGDGLFVEADNHTRLGLSQIEGAVSVGGSSFALDKIAFVESDGEGTFTLATMDGQRLSGKLGDTEVRAGTIWSAKPIELSLAKVRRATMREVDWSYVNAKGRRLVDRLEFEAEDLRAAAELLDSADFQEAGELLAKARTVRGRDRAAKRHLKLLGGVASWRAGQYEEARTVFRTLKGGRDQVRWVADSYMMLLEEHPEHSFGGQPLSEPDVVWRASTYKARQVLGDARRRFEKAVELRFDKNVKELRKLEAELEAANRLELGSTQSLLMEVLRAEGQAYWVGYNQMVDEYNEAVEAHNRQRARAQQHKFARKLSRLEKKLAHAEKEAARVWERYRADVTGFVVEPPKFERGRR